MSLINDFQDQYQTPFILSKAGYKVNRPGIDYLFKKTQLPWVGEIDVTPYVTDADMRKLESAMIKDTYAHRHRSFSLDNAAQSFKELTVAVMVGEGINCSVDDDEEAGNIINDWNDEINVKHQTIEDLINDSWADNLINAKSLWRVYVDQLDEDPDHLVDLQRVSMGNIIIDSHPTRGWTRFIQRANIPRRHMTKSVYYRADPLILRDKEYVETIIPNEPQCCIYVNFFDTPPVSTVLHLLVYKRWITWFMRKFAEKYWAPFIIGYVGDPKNGYMPTNKKDKDEALAYTLQSLKKIRDFGVGAFLATNEVKTLDTQTAKNSNIYTEYLEYINKEIVLGLHGSMALRQDATSGKATTDVVQQGYLRFIRGIRHKYTILFRKFYALVLLPAYGKEGKKPTDIKITWPPMRMENIRDTLQAVDIAAKMGAFKDAKEIRRILTPIWPHITDKISDKEASEMKKLFLELNSPSRAEGDAPQQRAGASTGKPAKKPVASNK